MKNTFILLLTLLATNGSAQFPKSLKDAASKVMPAAGGLSNDDVIAGLKEALTKGAGNSVSLASVADGFNKNARIRIPFPPEAEKMKSTLSTIGMNKQVEEFELTLNRAAEEAVKQAVPIFSDAVKGMSIGDGFAILKGKDGGKRKSMDVRVSDVALMGGKREAAPAAPRPAAKPAAAGSGFDDMPDDIPF